MYHLTRAMQFPPAALIIRVSVAFRFTSNEFPSGGENNRVVLPRSVALELHLAALLLTIFLGTRLAYDDVYGVRLSVLTLIDVLCSLSFHCR